MVEQLAVGGKIPKEITLMASSNITQVGVCAVPKKKTSNVLCQGRVVILAVPGAFTPGCHLKHLPEFIERFEEFKAKGIDAVFCLSTNDVFVLDAWGKALGLKENTVELLADGNAEFAEAAGLCQDLTKVGMGAKRYKRFALIANNGVVEYIAVGDVDVSGAGPILSKL